tara:strand:+ start:285 stop:431 length:147 start_codon:yes stop_codon:yes gene_type:complete
MRKNIKRKIEITANAVMLGTVACMCIYGTLVLTAAKSMLKMQSQPVDY